MSETEDPRAALHDNDVTVRAAAARDLGRDGTLDDVGPLLELAIADRSPSIRLYAAAAAAAVLRRVRREASLPRAVSDRVLDGLRRFDPQQNPSVLLVLGAVGPSVRGRLGRLLRDPHSDVRMAAVAALRAEALSPLSLEEPELLEQLGTWASTRSLPADARLDLGRLLGEVGHPDGAALLRGLAADVRDPDGVLDEAQARVRARAERGAYTGVWRLQQPEVLVPPDAKADVDFVGLTDETWFEEGGASSLTWGEDGRPVGPEGPVRLIWVGVPGQPAHAALQTATATRFALVDKALAGWSVRHIDDLRGMEPLCRVLLAQLDGVDGTVAPRARALLRWRAGDAAGAGQALDTMLAAKKPKPDLHWWRANVALAEGDLDLAREHVRRYLELAPTKAAHRSAAEGLRASLAG